MQRLQAFKFELRPTGEQTGKLRQFAGCCRYVYNQALALQQENYQAGGSCISYVTMANQLPGWRKEEYTSWLSTAPAHPLQQALRDLDRAYQNFFAGRAGFPCFKKKGRGDSFRFPAPRQFKLDQGNSRLFLPKLGWLRYRNLDQGWGEFRRQLGYKLDWTGGELITVPARYTSQQCSNCGHIAKENRQSQAQFWCVSCSHTQNADTNAANNIVAAGHAVMALVRHSGGGDIRPDAHASAHQAAPVKQAPAGPPRLKRFRH